MGTKLDPLFKYKKYIFASKNLDRIIMALNGDIDSDELAILVKEIKNALPYRYCSFKERSLYSFREVVRHLLYLKEFPKDKNLRVENLKLYNIIHTNINKAFDKKRKCSFCGEENRDMYHMALKNGLQYSFNVEDYLELCVSCHFKYDTTEEKREMFSRIFKKNPNDPYGLRFKDYVKKGEENHNARAILKIDRYTNEVIKEYEWVGAALIDLNKDIRGSNISNCLRGRAKAAYGFVWKYKN